MGYIPLRTNLEKCWPIVLQVCRQIYHESLTLMYQGKTFELEVEDGVEDNEDGNLGICSRNFLPYQNANTVLGLQLQFRNITSIKILIRPVEPDLADARDLKFRISILVNFLETSKFLKRLDIILMIYDLDPDEFDCDYERGATWLLKPFDLLRNLEHASLDVQGINFLLSRFYHNALTFSKHGLGVTIQATKRKLPAVPGLPAILRRSHSACAATT
jgi:hypothetical protein